MIQDTLGQGGFGITYRATDTKLNRPVALKEFFPRGIERGKDGVMIAPTREFPAHHFEAFRTGFIEEGRLLASLDHPAIVPVHHVFEANGTAYLVMKLLTGQTVEAYFEEQVAARGATGLSWETAVGLIRSLEDVLTYLHSQEILHRDIKPANLFRLTNGQIILLDFGAARGYLADQPQTMTFIGTRGFAPPEQSEKRARRGAFTDVYALAATLYYLLTGEPPMNAMIRLHEDTQPAPHELVPGIPTWLSEAVMCGLAPVAAQRPQTMADFCALLTPPTSESHLFSVTQSRWLPGYINRVEKLANAIEDDYYKAVTLGDIAITRAKIDPQKTEEMLQKAFQILTDLENNSNKASALGDIAVAWMTIDHQKALQVVNDITDDYDQALALRKIAVAWVQSNPHKAEEMLLKARQVVNDIENDYDRATILGTVIRTWVKIDPQKALQIVNNLNEFDKAFALRDIAVVWINIDPQKAEEMLQKARELANDIENYYAKAALLGDIAAAWAKIDPQRTEAILLQALQIANSIEDEFNRSTALETIATTWVKIDPQQSLQIIHDMGNGMDEDDFDPSFALWDIATAWVKCDADAVLQHALSLSGELRDNMIRGIARGLAEMTHDGEED